MLAPRMSAVAGGAMTKGRSSVAGTPLISVCKIKLPKVESQKTKKIEIKGEKKPAKSGGKK